MTVPPPPTAPPTIGAPDAQPEPEWWRKNGPWNPSTSKPGPVDLGKPRQPADDAEEQAEQHSEPWVRRVRHNLHGLISQTPQEQAANARRRREDTYQEQGETPEEREARHQRERRSAERHASILWRQPQTERARRFRRWCILTAASAAAGYLLHLPQALTHLPLPVGVGAVFLSWLLDHKMRGGGHVRVTQVRGPAVLYLCLVRVPLASALFAVLGLTPLFALTTHH
ncbi:hypothetical protein ACIRVF_08190 [Kitasatospora sp. NPDC101157]|uniref:hypothetical protein n=1 Tax=Kitasatospora sp. NPDC101157 TaxID=3364098 RepID=UPI0038078702